MRTLIRGTCSSLLVTCVLVGSGTHHARAFDLGDVKKKAQEKAQEEAKKALEQKVPANVPDATTAAIPPSGEDPAGGDVAISQVSTKFDFVPGDQVLFFDDFSGDESGDFPKRWRLISGNLDVAEFEGRKWLRLAGADGMVMMKPGAPLPERWTSEFDLHAKKAAGILSIYAGASGRTDPWWVGFGPHGNDVLFAANKKESYSPLPAGNFAGHHHVAFMADGHGLKVYVDRERVANHPEIEWTAAPESLTLRFRYQQSEPLLTNVRLAERSVPKPDLLEVPFVTHGIRFDTGSDRVRPESAPTAPTSIFRNAARPPSRRCWSGSSRSTRAGSRPRARARGCRSRRTTRRRGAP